MKLEEIIEGIVDRKIELNILIEKGIGNSLYDLDDLEDLKDSSELSDFLEEQGLFDTEIIYYSNAIAYLAENDPSLMESLGLASKYGMEIDTLNSEVLASMLSSQNVRKAYWEVSDSFDTLLEELEELVTARDFPEEDGEDA